MPYNTRYVRTFALTSLLLALICIKRFLHTAKHVCYKDTLHVYNDMASMLEPWNI